MAQHHLMQHPPNTLIIKNIFYLRKKEPTSENSLIKTSNLIKQIKFFLIREID